MLPSKHWFLFSNTIFAILKSMVEHWVVGLAIPWHALLTIPSLLLSHLGCDHPAFMLGLQSQDELRCLPGGNNSCILSQSVFDNSWSWKTNNIVHTLCWTPIEVGWTPIELLGASQELPGASWSFGWYLVELWLSSGWALSGWTLLNSSSGLVNLDCSSWLHCYVAMLMSYPCMIKVIATSQW